MNTTQHPPAAPAAPSIDQIFFALSDPARRRIYEVVRDRAPESVRDIWEKLATTASRPSVSQHLSVLLGAGLVTRQRGHKAVYRVVPGALRSVAEWCRMSEALDLEEVP